MSQRAATGVALSFLMQSGALHEAQMVSDIKGAGPLVRSLLVARRWTDLQNLTRDSLVLLLPEEFQGGWLVDAVVRLAWERYAAGIVVPREFANQESSRRLATRFGVWLITAEMDEPITFAVELGTQIAAPKAHMDSLLATHLASIARLPADPDRVVAATARALRRCQVALMSTAGTLIAGHDTTINTEGQLHGRSQRTWSDSGLSIRARPVGGDRERPDVWLVVATGENASEWLDTMTPVLDVASARLAEWAAKDRLTVETDASYRGSLLVDLLGGEGEPDPGLRARAERLGWRLNGWHVGFHLTVPTTPDPQTLAAQTRGLSRELRDREITAPLIERADGWCGWISFETEATSPQLARVVRQLQQVLSDRPLGLRLSGGVGRLRAALPGLRESLAEARTAAQLAVLAGTGTVELAEDMGVKRMLLELLGAPHLRELAACILEPLETHKDATALIDTLAHYLENGASTTQAAEALKIHRNTVTARLRRVAALLLVDLDNPDQRLALQLAVRARRSGSGD